MKKLFKRIIAKIRAGLLKLCKGVPRELYKKQGEALDEALGEFGSAVDNFVILHSSYLLALGALTTAFHIETAPDGREIYNNGICEHCAREGQEICRECQGVSKFIFKGAPQFTIKEPDPRQQKQ